MASAQIWTAWYAMKLFGPDSKLFNVMDVFAGIIESATLVSFQHYYMYYWYERLPLIYSDS